MAKNLGSGGGPGEAPAERVSSLFDEIARLLAGCCSRQALHPVKRALADVVALYRGEWPGYGRCHTPYHDLQHALDVALTLARLLHGYHIAPQTRRARRALPERLIALGLVCALFHDAGYLRKRADRRTPHGAAYTAVHVRRSGRFLTEYLQLRGQAQRTALARRIVAYTAHGPAHRCDADDPVGVLGCMLASADLLAQVADRWYLEKCLYRLHPEFVIAGMLPAASDGRASARAMLEATPGFLRQTRRALDDHLGGVHSYLEQGEGGRNLYLEGYRANLRRLEQLLASDNLERLQPPPSWPLG